MAITIRQTLDSDVAAAEACLSDGKRALAAMGIPQWQDEYPNRIDIEADRAQGASYVAVDDDGTVLGVMALSFDGEETYDAIDGAWLTESTSRAATYAVIHRCAVSAQAARGRGALSMRIDTHERNVPMRGLVGKLGYERCGVITLPYEGGRDPLRIAYEKVL